MHQLSRLRLVKNLSDAEVELIVRSIAENLRTYEQIIEVSILITQIAGNFGDFFSIRSSLPICPRMLEDYSLLVFACSTSRNPFGKPLLIFSTSCVSIQYVVENSFSAWCKKSLTPFFSHRLG